MTREASKSSRDFDRLLDFPEALDDIQGHPQYPNGEQAWNEDKYYRGYCERQLGIIGEAATRLTADFSYESKHPEVPWRQIKGLRNILVHMYWGSDPKVLWTIVDKRVPDLKVKIDSWIQEKQKGLEHEPEPQKSEKKESKLARKVRELAEKELDEDVR